MKVEFSAIPKAFSGNVAVFVAAEKQLLATARSLNGSGGAITRAIGAGRFTGAKQQTLTVLGQAGGLNRLMLLGIGKAGELDARTAEGLGGQLVADANGSGQKAVTVVVDAVKGTKLSVGEIAAHIALGACLRNYRFDKYKTKDKPEQKLSLEKITVVLANPAEARKAYAGLEPTIDAVFFTRDLVSEPANVLYPVSAINSARQMATGFTVSFLSFRQLGSLNISSATLPSPQHLEQQMLSGNPNSIAAIDSSYHNVFAPLPAPTAMPQNVANQIDIGDAQAEDAIKKAIELDAFAEREMEVAQKLNDQIAVAAPGTAPILDAEASAWVLQANAYTQMGMAELLRVNSATVSNRSGQLKDSTAQMQNMNQRMIQILTPR